MPPSLDLLLAERRQHAQARATVMTFARAAFVQQQQGQHLDLQQVPQIKDRPPHQIAASPLRHYQVEEKPASCIRLRSALDDSFRLRLAAAQRFRHACELELVLAQVEVDRREHARALSVASFHSAPGVVGAPAPSVLFRHEAPPPDTSPLVQDFTHGQRSQFHPQQQYQCKPQEQDRVCLVEKREGLLRYHVNAEQSATLAMQELKAFDPAEKEEKIGKVTVEPKRGGDEQQKQQQWGQPQQSSQVLGTSKPSPVLSPKARFDNSSKLLKLLEIATSIGDIESETPSSSSTQGEKKTVLLKSSIARLPSPIAPLSTSAAKIDSQKKQPVPTNSTEHEEKEDERKSNVKKGARQQPPQVALCAVSKRRARTFAQKLMDVLINHLTEHDEVNVASWFPDGRSFCIVNPTLFVTEVMTRVFHKSCKYESLARKLNRWGFVRMTSGACVDVFSHEFFRRDKIDLVLRMTCKEFPTSASVPQPKPSAGATPAAALDRHNSAEMFIVGEKRRGEEVEEGTTADANRELSPGAKRIKIRCI